MVAAITRSISGTTGSFSQVYAELDPRAEDTPIARMVGSGSRTFLTSPATQRLAKGSIIAIRPLAARAFTASAQAAIVGNVSLSSSAIRRSILPPSRFASAIAWAV